MNHATKDNDLWSIILAGGNGMRLRPLIEQWLGRHKPKQYCTFIGTRSMLQHTLDRADQLCTPEHKVTVIAREHLCEASALPVEGRAGKVILQPVNRDTAAAIFLALAHVRAHDPKATVVLYPSDHFVYPEDRFIGVVRCAIKAARQLKDHIILLGVPPDKVDLEYGWEQGAPQSLEHQPLAKPCRETPSRRLSTAEAHPIEAVGGSVYSRSCLCLCSSWGPGSGLASDRLWLSHFLLSRTP